MSNRSSFIALLLAVALVVLLLTVDTSLQTSVIWDRTTAWTPWLYKIGPLAVSDFVIICVSVYVLVSFFVKPKILSSPYVWLLMLLGIYLGIGLIYNLLVFPFLKTFLYDVKVCLYLGIPFIFLWQLRDNSRICAWFSPRRIFLYSAIAAIFDFLMVTFMGASEYPSFLGYPPIRGLFPFSLLIAALIFAKNRGHKILFSLILLFEIISAVNRLSMGSIFAGIVALLYIGMFRLSVGLPARIVLVFVCILGVNLVAVGMISNPFNLEVFKWKEMGAQTRKIQLENVMLNFNENIPGVIGKGLGSTWYELAPLPEEDIYSVGTSVADSTADAMASPVKFIFNWTPPALLYKWGVLGTLALCCLVAVYFEVHVRRIRYLLRQGLSDGEYRYLYAILILSTIYIIENFTYIGEVKASMICSLLAFNVVAAIQGAADRAGAVKANA